jgi:hypothetical protein
MSDTSTSNPSGRRCRLTKPERIDIGSDELVRNDVLAAEKGMSERTMNRGDAQGAPFTFVAGVKYRPLRAYHEFLASLIQCRNQSAKRRQAERQSRKSIKKLEVA